MSVAKYPVLRVKGNPESKRRLVYALGSKHPLMTFTLIEESCIYLG